MKYQMRYSTVKAFAIFHASCSLIPTLFVPPAWLKAWERAVLGRLGFTEALEMFRCLCYLACIESRAELTPPPRPHLVAPRAVLHSHGPRCPRALLHKAQHSGWYGPHLPLQALLHSLPPSCWTALPTCSPHCRAPQGIYSPFLQQCHVRKAAKAFVAKMPCKQRGGFTPPHTPKLLWCCFFKWPPGTLCEQDTHRRAGSCPSGAVLQPEPPSMLSTRAPAASRPRQGVPGKFAPIRAPMSGMLSGKHCRETISTALSLQGIPCWL